MAAATALGLLTACASNSTTTGNAPSGAPSTAPAGTATSPTSSTSTGTSAWSPPPASPSTTRLMPPTAGSAAKTVAGVDVSAYQPKVDWPAVADSGARFTWIKVSEGTTWTNRYRTEQRRGARAAGLFTGGYHYARPKNSSGAEQARHFVRSGGGWQADGRTLPGALDLEKNPDGAACYGKTSGQMVSWIRDFTRTYREQTGRNAVIYVRADWWSECTGDNTTFAATNPLWLYDHEGPMGPVPAGWKSPTVWQYGVRNGLDRNRFLGTQAGLNAWAKEPGGRAS